MDIFPRMLQKYWGMQASSESYKTITKLTFILKTSNSELLNTQMVSVVAAKLADKTT